MAAAGEDLIGQVQTLTQQLHELAPPGPCTQWQSAAVARVPDLAGQLVRAAVRADRQAGASWAQIGAGLNISAEAARSRFGRSREPRAAAGMV
ncbi:hypothetical protein OG763_00615 [Streptomyces sp. NBC_01230]|uniref:hypothetical protein n=1 Tax=unclassified Streptomyces TaxID=2593676 RepID=UPI002E1013C7|nr:hypothetical protein OG763_00615 [Streptomyces sp. NBC_01230]